jgi:hypothetical protein
MRMVTTHVTAAAEGFEYRTFEGLKCGHGETKEMPADPVATQVADGWLKGELGQSLEEQGHLNLMGASDVGIRTFFSG